MPRLLRLILLLRLLLLRRLTRLGFTSDETRTRTALTVTPLLLRLRSLTLRLLGLLSLRLACLLSLLRTTLLRLPHASTRVLLTATLLARLRC